MTVELSPGDFVYQSDQELFLVVMGETEDSYQFAAHGWREIDKDRLTEYLEHQNGELYDEERLLDSMKESADEDQLQKFERLYELFEVYDGDFEEEGPHTEFSLDDT